MVLKKLSGNTPAVATMSVPGCWSSKTDSQINHIHASGPDFPPRSTHFVAQFGMVVLEIKWASSEANKYSIDRAAHYAKQHRGYHDTKDKSNTDNVSA